MMNEFYDFSPENGNGKYHDGSKIPDFQKRAHRPSRSFYMNRMARENPDYFTNLFETIRTHVGKIARIFSLSEQEEDVLVEMTFLQLELEIPEEDQGGNFSFSQVYPLLTPDSRIRRFGLIEAPENQSGMLLEFVIPERMIFAFLGIQAMDAQIEEMTTMAPPSTKLPASREEFARNIGGMIRNKKATMKTEPHPGGIILELTDIDRTDLLSVAILALQESGHEPLLLRLRSIFHNPEIEATFIRLWNRDSRISPLAAIVDLTGEESNREYNQIVELVRALHSPVIVLSDTPKEGFRQKFMHFSLPELNPVEQDELWEAALASTGDTLKPHIYDLTNSFLLKPSDIARISAHALGGDPNGENVEKVVFELRNEAKKATRPPIRDLATLINAVTTLEDLAVPDKTRNLLIEIVNRVKSHRKVLYDFGFKKKFGRGLAITALFYGESGTGKTHAAEAIAGELDLDLYRIDLSRVISKYVGETEKNLGRIFDGAKNSGAILLFDEADALFGKRSEVTDSHDRYANQEISYLLQKMEEYTGLSILTSNLAENMDPAFNRRITYRLVFPMTDARTRQSICERIFPKETNTHNLNFAELAKELELTGAEIKNLALRASYVAAFSNEPVKMKHIRQVLKDELNKMDILINDGDLPHWYHDE